MLAPSTLAEGYRIDHFGNAINTAYVDLREPAARHPIPALVKGCRPEHVIEEYGIVKVSTPRTFRDSGENLVRDPAEGYYSDTRVLRDAVDDPRDLTREREHNAALNRVAELVGFDWRRNTTSTHTKISQTETLEYAPVGWLFCASIEPSTPEEWTSWRATLEEGYTSVSRIYRPREFALALGHMAAEQLGPQGTMIPVKSTIKGFPSSVTNHPSQLIFHGPVVYVDDMDSWLREARSEVEYFLRAVFSKSATHRDQREYRFVIWADTKPENDVHLLRASSALIDAMTKHGNDPTPPAMHAVDQEEDSLSPYWPAEPEPNPLAGITMWSDLASSIVERGRQPEAVMRPSQLDPASLPDDFDRQMATYAGLRALRDKVESCYRLPEQTVENKHAVAAAAWFAEQDIRALCETFENPIAGVSISEEGFVVIHVSVKERSDLVCLLAVAPSGESGIRSEIKGRGWVNISLSPFNRSNIGQYVKEFLETPPFSQQS